MSAQAWRWVLLTLAAASLVLGLWAVVHPPSFQDEVAGIGPTNDHLVRDYGVASLAFTAGLVAAAFVDRWRTPMIGVALVWNALHTLNHLADLGRTSPAYLGPLQAVALVGTTLLLGYLLGVAWREEQQRLRVLRA